MRMSENNNDPKPNAVALDALKYETANNDRGKKSGESVVTTEALMKGQKSLGIWHGDELYQLRITHAGRLILTK